MAGVTTFALLALSAAKTATTYADQRRAAGAAERQGNHEGDILDQNAHFSDLQAADVRRRGTSAELSVRRETRQLAGSQRAAMASQGIDINSGSARDVVENDQALSELDALTIRSNARRQAWGYEVQAYDQRRQADLARIGGRNQADSIRRQSVGTLLSGAGELASIYQAAPKKISRRGSVSTSPAPNPSPSSYSGGQQRTSKGRGAGSSY